MPFMTIHLEKDIADFYTEIADITGQSLEATLSQTLQNLYSILIRRYHDEQEAAQKKDGS